MWRILRALFFFSEEAFLEIKNTPRMGRVGILIFLLTMAKWILSYPGMARYYQFVLAEKGIPANALADGANLLNILSLPFFLFFLIATLLSEVILLNLAAKLSLVKTNFRNLFALVLWCYCPAAIGGVIHGGLICFAPPMVVPYLGLHLAMLIPKGEGFFWRLMAYCNPFSIYSFLLLLTGAEKIAGIKKHHSGTMIMVAWLILVLIGAAIGYLPGQPLNPRNLNIELIS